LALRFSSLGKIINDATLQIAEDCFIYDLFIDSRNPVVNNNSLFFAIKGVRNDGHKYIDQLYKLGVKNFVVEHTFDTTNYQAANFLKVANSVDALQAIAKRKRQRFQGQVIGVTGSNGKTITKEWLGQLLQDFFNVYRSPRSYNSQVGVPLSIWPLTEHHDFAILEAGISQTGEMEKLEEMIMPSIGIFTNLGTAHDSGFESLVEKGIEKAKLFTHSDTIIFCTDYPEITHALYNLERVSDKKMIGWSFEDNTSSYYVEVESRATTTAIRIPFLNKLHVFEVPFSDHASLENIVHCLLCLLNEGIPTKLIQQQLNELKAVSMRLEVKQGIHQSYLVDDSYNNDLVGLDTALQFFHQQKQQAKRVVILSDLLESGSSNKALYQLVADRINNEKIDLFIGVGENISSCTHLFADNSIFFNSTEELVATLKENPIKEAVILIKGARKFLFEKIANHLAQKIHGTVLEINLNAITHNLNFYRSKLRPNVKTMAMVKAFAYGSGSNEIANWLQYQQIDYLAVAYADEGVILRERGITVPIMVMNPSRDTFDTLFKNQLEPEIYSEEILIDFISFTKSFDRKAKIHLELDTGMNRLGFKKDQLEHLLDLLKNAKNIQVASIFSHLAASDEARHNGFSARQAFEFKSMSDSIIATINYRPILHLLNSPGISRFPDFQFDMVRLGVGLYGVDATETHQEKLMTVSSLKTVISQIKQVRKGETIGYSRQGVAQQDMVIAIIAVGYADGYDRKLSNGLGKVLINGKFAATIGNVCMDMTMVDITNIDCKTGDQVTVFGEKPSIFQMAQSIGTIPYEILTNVSTRVKRVFYSE
jgi:alanine racemase